MPRSSVSALRLAIKRGKYGNFITFKMNNVYFSTLLITFIYLYSAKNFIFVAQFDIDCVCIKCMYYRFHSEHIANCRRILKKEGGALPPEGTDPRLDVARPHL